MLLQVPIVHERPKRRTRTGSSTLSSASSSATPSLLSATTAASDDHDHDHDHDHGIHSSRASSVDLGDDKYPRPDPQHGDPPHAPPRRGSLFSLPSAPADQHQHSQAAKRWSLISQIRRKSVQLLWKPPPHPRLGGLDEQSHSIFNSNTTYTPPMPDNDFVGAARYPASLLGPSDPELSRDWEAYLAQSTYGRTAFPHTRLKKLARRGIPDKLRGAVWARLLNVSDLSEFETDYNLALKRTYGSVIPEQPVPPTFAGRLHRRRLALNSKGMAVAEHILAIVAHDFPTLDFCPFVPPLAVLIVHHAASADAALGTMVAVMQKALAKAKPGTASGPGAGTKSMDELTEWLWFPTVHKELGGFLSAFLGIFQKFLPRVYRHVMELYKPVANPSASARASPVTSQAAYFEEYIWTRWITDFFLDVLPLGAIFRVLDSFFIEGYKVVFKYALGLLAMHSDKILQCKTIDKFYKLFDDAALANIDVNTLADKAFSFSFSKSQVRESIRKTDEEGSFHIPSPISAAALASPMSAHTIDEDNFQQEAKYRHQRLVPKLLQESSILKNRDELWIVLWTWIPPRFRCRDLELLFTTNEHGYHLMNFFERTRDVEPSILLVETTDGKIFGAFCTKPWATADEGIGSGGDDHADKGSFFGTGETFLFTLAPFAKLYPWVGMLLPPSPTSTTSSVASSSPIRGGDTRDDPTSSTREELEHRYIHDQCSFFQMATRKELVVGGGGNEFGLWLNETLTQGSTGRCNTFDNMPLTGVAQLPKSTPQTAAAAAKATTVLSSSAAVSHSYMGTRFECRTVELFGFSD